MYFQVESLLTKVKISIKILTTFYNVLLPSPKQYFDHKINCHLLQLTNHNLFHETHHSRLNKKNKMKIISIRVTLPVKYNKHYFSFFKKLIFFFSVTYMRRNGLVEENGVLQICIP